MISVRNELFRSTLSTAEYEEQLQLCLASPKEITQQACARRARPVRELNETGDGSLAKHVGPRLGQVRGGGD